MGGRRVTEPKSRQAGSGGLSCWVVAMVTADTGAPGVLCTTPHLA